MTPDAYGWMPIEEIERHKGLGYSPVLVWDDYHGMVVAKRDPLRNGQWHLDAPYAFEMGSKEFDLTPSFWQPLPAIPEAARRRL